MFPCDESIKLCSYSRSKEKKGNNVPVIYKPSPIGLRIIRICNGWKFRHEGKLFGITRHCRDATVAAVSTQLIILQTWLSHIMRKPVYAMCDKKGSDQPAHMCSLISAFIICRLDSIIPWIAISKNFKTLASLCRWVSWLCLTWSQTHKDTFSRDRVQLTIIRRQLLWSPTPVRRKGSLRAQLGSNTEQCLNQNRVVVNPSNNLPVIWASSLENL